MHPYFMDKEVGNDCRSNMGCTLCFSKVARTACLQGGPVLRPAPPAATVLATLHVSLLNPHRDPEARCFSNQFILQLRLSHLHKTHS